jgi:hypothetical protein
MEEINIEDQSFDPSIPVPPEKGVDPIEEISIDIKKKNIDPTMYANMRMEQNSIESQIFKPEKLKTYNFEANLDNAYTRLNSGNYIARFENFLPGTNNEERLARQQSGLEQWGNGLAKLGLKTGTAILGGTLGVVNGIGNMITQGSLEAMYNNDFDKWLDDLNTKMDYKLPNYYTEQQKDAGFVDSLGTVNFWANDVTSGLSFTLGMVVSEGIWAAATGGTSVFAKLAGGGLARWGSKALTTEKSLLALTKYKEIAGKSLLRAEAKGLVTEGLEQTVKRGARFSNLANNTRTLITSAGYEAGVEARHYIKSTEENWLNSFEELNGREPSASERAIFKEELNSTANLVFGSNLALVGASNITMYGKLINGSPINQTVKNSLIKNKVFGIGYKTVDGKKIALEATKGQKIARGAYTFGKYGTLEGFVEEGGQGVITSTGENYMIDTYSSENIDTSIGIMDSMIKGFQDSYGTKEGRKAIGIGAIIGLFGGGMSTGFKFNEKSSEAKELKKLVDLSNITTSELVVNRMKELSRIQNATRRESEAKSKGDVTGEVTARKEVLQARAIRDIRLGGLNEGIKDLESFIAKTSNQEISESAGIELSEVDEYKSEIINEYKDIAKKTQKNLNFAEALLGSTPIAGLKGLNQKDLAERMTYTLTMGEVSDEIADDMINTVKDIVSINLGVESNDVLNVENVLRKVDPKNLEALRQLNIQLELNEKKEKALQRKVIDLQAVSKKDNESYASNLNNANKALLESQEQRQQLQLERETAFAVANIATFSNGEVSLEMLTNQAKNFKTFKDKLGALKPNDRANVERLFTNYESAVGQTKRFNKAIELFTDPNLRVSTLNGWVSKLINKNKELDSHLAEFFKEVNEVEQVKELSQIGALSQPPKVEVPTETTIVTDTEANSKDLTIIQKLEKEIGELLNKNNFLKQYVGDTNEVDIELKKEDTDRFSELLSKITVDPQFVMSYPFDKNRGLTEAETEEFKNLNNVLNNWRVVDGSGIGDKLRLIQALKTELENQNTKITTSVRDIVLASQPKGSEDGSQNVKTVQSPSVKLVKYVKKRGVYELSHTNIESLLDIIPNSIITYKGKNILELNNKVLRKEGNKFTLKVEDKEIDVIITQYSRLEIKKEDLDGLLPSNTFIRDFSVNNFMPLFKDGKIVEGDFGYASSNGENINYNEDSTNDVQRGDVVITEINLNDTFNKNLLEEYNAGKITKQEFANKVQIYVKPKGTPNIVAGSLRALGLNNATDISTSALMEIRSEAIDRILSRTSDKIDLEIEIPVEKVLLGNPNVVIDETGKPITIPFTSESIGQVVATGYAIDGVVTINKDIDFNPAIAKRTSENNKGEKIPVVVFKYRNQTIAYPVNLIETTTDLSQKGEEILNTALSPNQKAEQFIKYLLESKLDPQSFGIDYSAVNWMDTTATQTALDALSSKKDTPDIETWIQPNYSPINLISQAQISVDITNRPILASKIVLKLEDRIPYSTKEAQMSFKERLQNKRITLVESLNDSFMELRSIFMGGKSNTGKEEESAFQVALQDAEKNGKDMVVKLNPTTYNDFETHVTMLEKAFSNKIPKKTKAIIGKERIESIEQRIIELKRTREAENTTPKPNKDTEVVSDVEYTIFINTGDIAKSTLNKIADKIKNNIKLTIRETAIFTDRTAEINEILVNSVTTITEQEMSDIVQALIGGEIETVEELLPELIAAFYVNGEFAPTLQSLESSLLYDKFQAKTLISNNTALEKIKQLITKLQENVFMC